MLKMIQNLLLLTVCAGMFQSVQADGQSAVDASDPTKVYTFAGVGLKYTDYTNGDSMNEVRATGNLGLSPSDTLLFELGYGFHNGDAAPAGKNEGLTNARLRYFHLFKMDYEKMGYRGMAAQVDLQIAGQLKGTDGQNVLALGGLGAWGINEVLNFYAGPIIPNSWDKKFETYNGSGIGATALLVYTPDLWSGCYFQLWPTYNYFVNGNLKDEGSGNIDLVAGGSFTETLTWNITFQQNLDKDLNAFRQGRDTGLNNDWNLFGSVTAYF
jgi:hypothetical protein